MRTKDYVWGLTGSPIPRAVTDVWGPCSCLTPHTVPKFFTIFRDQLMLKKGPFKWEPKPDAEERAVACMQPSVRFKLIGRNGVTREGNQVLPSGLDAQAELCLRSDAQTVYSVGG